MREAHGQVAAGSGMEAAVSIVRRRAKPSLLILDESLAVAFADREAMELLSPDDPSARNVNPLVVHAIRDVVASWNATGYAGEAILAQFPGVILRVNKLEGAAGTCIAVFVEQHAVREDLLTASKRYRLTPRELEVLTLVLRGCSTTDVAERLTISELTAVQHCKNVLRKTGSKNRTEMIAKILGWMPRAEATANAAPADELDVALAR